MAVRTRVKADVIVITAFAVAAGALWLAGGAPAPGMTGLWLGLLTALLAGVDFHVGAGRVSPVPLALVPMLLLVPGPVVPLVVAAAMTASRVPSWLRGGARGFYPLRGCGDAINSLGPALLLTLLPDPGTVAGDALLIAFCFPALIVCDLSMWPAYLWFGRGIDPRTELRTALWIYGFDALLVPLGFAIALAAREVPAAPLAILPLAGLLAFFVLERRLRADH